jgi:hypothetical protein
MHKVLKAFYHPVFFLSVTKPIIWMSHRVIIDLDEGKVFRSIRLHAFSLSLSFRSHSSHVTLATNRSCVHPFSSDRYCQRASAPFNSCLVQSWTMFELRALELHETQFPLFAPLWNYNGIYVYIR